MASHLTNHFRSRLQHLTKAFISSHSSSFGSLPSQRAISLSTSPHNPHRQIGIHFQSNGPQFGTNYNSIPVMTRNQQPLLHFPPQTVHTNPPRPTKTTQTRHYRSRPWEDDEPQYQRGNGGYRNPSKKLNDVLSHSEPVRYSSKHPNFPPNTQYMTPNERRLADLEEQLRPYHGVEFPDPAPKPPTPPTRIGNYQDSPTRFKPYPQYKSGFAPEPPPIENHASHNSAYEPTGTKFDNAPSYHQDGGGYQQYRANRNAHLI